MNPPDVNTTWKHAKSGRNCRVLGNRIVRDPAGVIVAELVEFRYVGGARRARPMQTMNLAAWLAAFTTQVP